MSEERHNLLLNLKKLCMILGVLCTSSFRSIKIQRVVNTSSMSNGSCVVMIIHSYAGLEAKTKIKWKALGGEDHRTEERDHRIPHQQSASLGWVSSSWFLSEYEGPPIPPNPICFQLQDKAASWPCRLHEFTNIFHCPPSPVDLKIHTESVGLEICRAVLVLPRSQLRRRKKRRNTVDIFISVTVKNIQCCEKALLSTP